MTFSSVMESRHRGSDDLLTAGLGTAGIRAEQAPRFAVAEQPTPDEVRRRAIYASWRANADLSPQGGYGTLYGHFDAVPGREYQAFAYLPEARSPHRVLPQAPDAFDRKARCLVVTASPGSRGIYGSIALAGAWGLPRGCAVAYTDKGCGSGYFDTGSDTGVCLDGTRAARGTAELEFEPPPATAEVGIKHAHSGDNPDARWGECVLQAVDFGLAMLDRAYPDAAPFTAANTRILAVGLSNGGSAVLRAAGLDQHGVLDGVVALSPNIHTPTVSRPFYDYTSEAALLFGSALAAPAFAELVRARYGEQLPYPAAQHGAALAHAGLLSASDPAAWPQEALDCLLAGGWTPAALQAGALINEMPIWRAAGLIYASAYLRCSMDDRPCNLRFVARMSDAHGALVPTDAKTRATWWADGNGIPPHDGIMLPPAADHAALVDDFLCLRGFWTGTSAEADVLRASVAATAAALPAPDLPVWIVHGADDGLIPMHFSSDAYVQWLRANDRVSVYWQVPHAQHSDGLLIWPALGARYLPLLPHAYAALDGLWRHLADGTTLPASATLETQPRGDRLLEATHLGLG
ncbi:3-hydroxybutyrate oligomer hydrolase family protein [Acidihalobacter ferrooxydans]|uniref:Hydrogenase n=1 Tax=Acidihalobacter ferrooxydans TaxID=1765967 RepID=A0A1P8UH67_9GAMM|nr:3-hydroxybutyrate oligomer hydrolase family protein [Acidihalobacter ferrooxydans]APZ43192.1 hypothetical protein BW247_08890 [Acidihalobacter ferrooxydans]